MRTMFTLQRIEQATGGEWLIPPMPDTPVRGVADDSRAIEPGQMFVAIRGEFADGHRFLREAAQAGAVAVCVDQVPDEATQHFLRSSHCGVLQVDDGLAAYHALATSHRQSLTACTVIGLTGSAGKTSVKEMLAAICRAAVGPEAVLATEGNTNNHFGVPRNLLRLTERHRCAIIELGSNQPGDIAQLTQMVQPDVAVVTNIGRAHLEKLGSIEGVAKEKADIVRGLRADGTAVLPFAGTGDTILKRAAGKREMRTFGIEDGADVRVAYAGWDGSGYRLTLSWGGSDVPVWWQLGGAHQARNAAAAAAVGLVLDIPAEAIVRGLRAAELPEMRAAVERRNAVLWFNDAYNANPDSMRAGLDLFAEIADTETARPLILVLGDMMELGECAPEAHREVLEHARVRFPEAHLLAVGPQMKEAADASDVEAFETADEAAQAVAKRLVPGAAVFLKGSRRMALEKIFNRS
ncbi:MAG: UDP-N-acetylmuramoyl-tripeptide--D-alanyl-D-alanine ligase [Verrucomicrobiota bacterium]